jgi:hypothetical protein
MVLFVSMLYSSAMPLLIWVGAAYFGLVSLSHKWEVPHRLSLLFPRLSSTLSALRSSP